jgi:hypothetical protein
VVDQICIGRTSVVERIGEDDVVDAPDADVVDADQAV